MMMKLLELDRISYNDFGRRLLLNKLRSDSESFKDLNGFWTIIGECTTRHILEWYVIDGLLNTLYY
jgi:hypothetical protein